jgi:hypothetical protein
MNLSPWSSWHHLLIGLQRYLIAFESQSLVLYQRGHDIQPPSQQLIMRWSLDFTPIIAVPMSKLTPLEHSAFCVHQ